MMERDDRNANLLFSESASRFIAEVLPTSRLAFETALQEADVPFAQIGEVTASDRLEIAWALRDDDPTPSALLVSLPLGDLKEAWQKPLRW
jgi:phosphoribosylformylglycinamidine synthase